MFKNSLKIGFVAKSLKSRLMLNFNYMPLSSDKCHLWEEDNGSDHHFPLR